MTRELAEVHWYVDGVHASEDNPHKSNSNASSARECVQAICDSCWSSWGDYPLEFDVVIIKPKEWAGRYPVEVEHMPNFTIGKAGMETRAT